MFENKRQKMQSRLVIFRLRLAAYQRWLMRSSGVFGHRALDPLVYIIIAFAKVPLSLLQWVVELPFHFRKSSMMGFNEIAVRGEHGEFLESYSSYLARVRMTVATMMLAVVAISVQFFALGYSIYTLLHPRAVEAYSTSTDLSPTWDDSAVKENFWGVVNPCSVDFIQYSTQGVSGTTMTYGKDVVNPSDCEVLLDYVTTIRRPAMKFSLSSIPDGATITGVNLLVNVLNNSNQLATIVRPTSDSVDTLNGTDGTLFNAIGSGTVYGSTTWSTTGAKNVALNASAVNDVQSRITGSDIIAIGIYTTEGASDSNDGAIGSQQHGTSANRPVLRVTYTLPPQTPTGFGKTAITTSSITWGWTDNATAETRYDVHDAAHATVTGCTNLAANSQSCTETGLSTNTQYTRHANVTDANGNTDSASAAAYSAIESPANVSIGTVGLVSISLSASGSFSNLATASSGLQFENTVASTNSGWTQTNSWVSSGLSPNTQYTFRVKARNGDATETAYSSTTNKYTLAASPDISPSQPTATWQTSSLFSFSEPGGFGPGNPIQYYRFVWNQSPSHIFAGTESTWSSDNAFCPGGTCTVVGPDLELNATTDGNDWYLHAAAYNAENVESGSQSYGPYYFDATSPTAPATVADGLDASDDDVTTSTTTLSANWTAATDAGSGLDHYEYAIGTTSGGTNIVSYTSNGTSTSFTRSNLTLSVGATYYVSVRAVDVANHVGAIRTSDGITVQSETQPTVTAISGVSVSVTTSSAVIAWTTNEPASGRVDFGLTSAYGTTVTEGSSPTAHSVTLSPLTASTTYHYQITSTGTTTAQTTDATFTTASVVAPAPDPTPVPRPRLEAPFLPTSPSAPMVAVGRAHGGQTVVFRLDGRIVGVIKISGLSTKTYPFVLRFKTSALSVGNHRLTARAHDQAGTLSAIVTQTIVVTDATMGSVLPKTGGRYIVQPGDSLWSIAQQFYGDGSMYNVLIFKNATAHPTLLNNPSAIQPGWVLQIPFL